MATNAHYVSKLTFGSVVWNKSITSKDRKKLTVNLNRVVWMNCKGIIKSFETKDKKRTSNRKHYEVAGLRSLTSLCNIADCSLLYKICVGMCIEPLCGRLMAQCHTSNHNPNRLVFLLQ